MKYGLSQEVTPTDCLIIGCFEDNTPINACNEKNHEEINQLFKNLNKKGDCLLQYHPQSFKAQALLLIHCGKAQEFDEESFQKSLKTAATRLIKSQLASAVVALPHGTKRSSAWHTGQIVLGINQAYYQFDAYKSDKSPRALESVTILASPQDDEALQQAHSVAQGVNLARDLGNQPGNVCTPSYLAQTAVQLAENSDKLVTNIIEQEQMQALGMGALLAVAKGSAERPKLIEMTYRGGQDSEAPIVLVGKGITFDSGGISLKPSSGMEEMKYDMGGAASVLGTMKALIALGLPINVIGLIASAENMPSSTAVKPGDVVTSLSGKTIEITNTDAEGRLVLCDALTYAERYEPKLVLDMATLTGAMVVALGEHYTGFFTENNDVATRLDSASQESHDKAWRMPLDDCYKHQLDSSIADINNASASRAAGSITAAYFLSCFTKKYPWAHLDIAGTAWVSGKNKCATGRPVPLLSQLLIDESRAN